MSGELPRCWIRGHMEKDEDYVQNDSVRLATIDCPFRKADRISRWNGKPDYGCSHPTAIKKEEERKASNETVTYLADSNNETFCTPVHMHLISLGEPSFLVIDINHEDDSSLLMLK